jgi:hypothetical protein
MRRPPERIKHTADGGNWPSAAEAATNLEAINYVAAT